MNCELAAAPGHESRTPLPGLAVRAVSPGSGLLPVGGPGRGTVLRSDRLSGDRRDRARPGADAHERRADGRPEGEDVERLGERRAEREPERDGDERRAVPGAAQPGDRIREGHSWQRLQALVLDAHRAHAPRLREAPVAEANERGAEPAARGALVVE